MKKLSLSVLGIAATLAFAACSPVSTSSDGTASNTTASGSSTSISKVDKIANTVPEEYRSEGKLDVVTTIGMAPLNYPNTTTGEVEGFNSDLANAIADVLGLEADITTASIDQIIPGLESDRYDVTFANMAVTEERRAVLDFTEYYFTASSLGVPSGNPEGITPETMCGRSIGVSNGSYQMTKVIPEASTVCTDNGQEEINIQAFPEQQKAVVAMLSGRIDAVAMDGPVLAYAITQEPRLENAGKLVKGSNVGIGVVNDDPLNESISAALQHLMDDGTYNELLDKWGMSELALTEAKIQK